MMINHWIWQRSHLSPRPFKDVVRSQATNGMAQAMSLVSDFLKCFVQCFQCGDCQPRDLKTNRPAQSTRETRGVAALRCVRLSGTSSLSWWLHRRKNVWHLQKM